MPRTDSPKPQPEQEFRQLKLFVNELFPQSEALQTLVAADTQLQELRRLRAGLRAEQFYFVVDFLNLTIVEAVGMEQIGYVSETFTFRQYLSSIPDMLQLITLLGKQTFILSNRMMLSFMKPKYVVQMPLRCQNGQTMLAKRTISPWQFTDTGRIIAYLAEFTLLKPWENEPLSPRFIDLDPQDEILFNSVVTRLFANLPPKENLFSPKEMGLLKLYIDDQYQSYTAKQLADLGGITLNTLNTHNKTIVAKARHMFGVDLTAGTAREVAQYVKKCGLIS